MRFRVRKAHGQWEVSTDSWALREWTFSVTFPTYWQAMVHVTGQYPYGAERQWCPHLRPLIAS